MHLNPHLERIHFIKNELSEVYVNLVIQTFTVSLIGILIPVYLLQLDYTINQVLLFFIAQFSAFLIFSPISALLANKFGFKHIILFRTPILIIYLIGLFFITQIPNYFYLLATLGGFTAALYWNSINSLFIFNSDKIHRGTEISKFVYLPRLATILSPAIGGFIAATFGFHILFVLTAILFGLSVIPLFLTKDLKPHVNFNINKLFPKHHFKFFIHFVAEGIKHSVEVVVWPIFIFIVANNVLDVGLATTISSAGSVLFTVFIGKLSDTRYRLTILKFGSVINSIIWFLKIFATNTFRIFSLGFLRGLFSIMIDIPYTASAYDHASKTSIDEFVVFREISLNIGRILVLIILLFAVNKFIIGFILASAASLVFLIFKD